VATVVQESKRCPDTNHKPTSLEIKKTTFAYDRHINAEGTSQKQWSTDSSDLTIRVGKTIHPTMKSALILVFLSTSVIASHGIVHQHRRTESSVHNTRASGGWGQAPSGSASFTAYTGCNVPCKLCVSFRGFVLHGVHANRDVPPQRAA
jgi:hypothetical protein